MELLTPSLGLFFWAFLALGIVVFILKKTAFTPIIEALKEREESIENSLKAAQAAKEEMQALTADNEAILMEARDEKNSIIKEAKVAAEKIREDAAEKTKAEGAKMIEEAKREIENQKMAAMVEVKNLVGSVALEVAEKVIRKNLNDQNGHENFIKELVKDIKLN